MYGYENWVLMVCAVPFEKFQRFFNNRRVGLFELPPKMDAFIDHHADIAPDGLSIYFSTTDASLEIVRKLAHHLSKKDPVWIVGMEKSGSNVAYLEHGSTIWSCDFQSGGACYNRGYGILLLSGEVPTDVLVAHKETTQEHNRWKPERDGTKGASPLELFPYKAFKASTKFGFSSFAVFETFRKDSWKEVALRPVYLIDKSNPHTTFVRTGNFRVVSDIRPLPIGV